MGEKIKGFEASAEGLQGASEELSDRIKAREGRDATGIEPLDAESGLAISHQDGAATPKPPAAPNVPWAVTQDGSSGLDTHNLVYYAHDDGKTYLLPRDVVERYKFEKEKYAEINAPAPSTVGQPLTTKVATGLAEIKKGFHGRFLSGADAVEGGKAALDTEAGVDVSSLTPAQRASHLKETNKAITEKQEHDAKVADLASRLGLKGGLYSGRAARDTAHSELYRTLTPAEQGIWDEAVAYRAEQRQESLVNQGKTAASLLPGVGVALALREGQDPKGPGGVFRSPEESKHLALETALTAADIVPIPAGRIIKGGFKTAKSFMPTKFGGYFNKASTPWAAVPKLTGSAYDSELLKGSIDIRKQLAETGSAEVIVGGKKFTIDQTRLDQAIRAQNPDRTLATTGSPDVRPFLEGGTVPEFHFPASKGGAVKPPQEQFQFLTPGGTGVTKFMDKSAFGHLPDEPKWSGLAVYGNRRYDQYSIPGAADEPLGTNYFRSDYEKARNLQGGREAELGVATGDTTAPIRPVAGLGSDGQRLFLSDDLVAPTYADRIKANVLSAKDVVTGQKIGKSRVATPDEIAESRFGKNPDDPARAGDDALAGGDDLARAGDDALAGGDDLARAGDDALAGGDDLARAGDDALAGGDDLARAGDDALAGGDDLARAGDDALAGGDDLARAGDDALAGGDDLARAGDDALAGGDDLGRAGLTSEQARYVDTASKSDAALKEAASQGDELADDVLRVREDAEQLIRRESEPRTPARAEPPDPRVAAALRVNDERLESVERDTPRDASGIDPDQIPARIGDGQEAIDDLMRGRDPVPDQTGAPDPVVVDRADDPVVVDRTADPVVVDRTADPVVVDRADDPVVVDRSDDPVVVDRTDDPVVVDRADDPVVVDRAVVPEGLEGITRSPTTDPVVDRAVVPEGLEGITRSPTTDPVVDRSDDPVVVDRSDDPVVVDRSDDPVVVDRSDDPVVVDRSDDPVVVDRTDDPVVVDRTDDPVVVDRTDDPVVVDRTDDPVVVDRSDDPVVVDRTDDPVVVDRTDDPVVVDRTDDPIITDPPPPPPPPPDRIDEIITDPPPPPPPPPPERIDEIITDPPPPPPPPPPERIDEIITDPPPPPPPPPPERIDEIITDPPPPPPPPPPERIDEIITDPPPPPPPPPPRDEPIIIDPPPREPPPPPPPRDEPIIIDPPPREPPPPPEELPRVKRESSDPFDTSRLPGPSMTLPRDDVPRVPVDEPMKSRPRPDSDDVTPDSDDVKAVPRPNESSYPRAIAHTEHIEYRYDPETDTVDGRIVQTSEPVVTSWDDSPPTQEQRAVGTWDVTPGPEGVEVEGGARVTVPDNMKAQLKQQAEGLGEPVTKTVALRYQHDLDTGTTRQDSRGSPEDMVKALKAKNTPKDGTDLNDKYKQMMEALQRKAMEQKQQQQQQRTNRRSASSRANEKTPSYKLPQIVVVQEAAGGGRRLGGL